MSVQSVELHFWRGLMTQNHDRTVVEWRTVVGQGMHDAVQGSGYTRAGRNEEIHPQVNRAPFIGGIGGGREQRRSVEPARLVVPADCDSSPRGLKGALEFSHERTL